MVSALDSRLSGPGPSPPWSTALCSWARHLTHSPLSTQVYKMGTGEFTAGDNHAMDYHPIQGERVEILPVASCYGN